MKVLIVCSKNSGYIAPFIVEQVEALEKKGVICGYFTIGESGIKGYLRHRSLLLAKIREFMPDVIHAHYGLSGLLANTQRTVPVVTTYHGSDINLKSVFLLSRINMLLSAYNIFVSQKNIDKSKQKRNFALIPCGVDTKVFFPIDKTSARKYFGFNDTEKLVLFSGTFANTVKNGDLAQKALTSIPDTKLIELKGFNRIEVALLMNAVDVCLMTSFTEGSPQFIKEAMACNCPIVSVPVGDVSEVTNGVAGCYIGSYDANDLCKKIELAIDFRKKTNGREKILSSGLDTIEVAEKIASIYYQLSGRK